MQYKIKLNEIQLAIFFPSSRKKSLFCQQCNFGIGTYCIGSLIKQKRIYQKWQNCYDCALCIICTKASYSCRVCCSGQHTGRILQRIAKTFFKHGKTNQRNHFRKGSDIMFWEGHKIRNNLPISYTPSPRVTRIHVTRFPLAR